jgi:hypothetical protein
MIRPTRDKYSKKVTFLMLRESLRIGSMLSRSMIPMERRKSMRR